MRAQVNTYRERISAGEADESKRNLVVFAHFHPPTPPKENYNQLLIIRSIFRSCRKSSLFLIKKGRKKNVSKRLKSAHIPALLAFLSMKLTFDPLWPLQFVGWEEEAARADAAVPGGGRSGAAGTRRDRGSNSAALPGPISQRASREGAGREGGSE